MISKLEKLKPSGRPNERARYRLALHQVTHEHCRDTVKQDKRKESNKRPKQKGPTAHSVPVRAAYSMDLGIHVGRYHVCGYMTYPSFKWKAACGGR